MNARLRVFFLASAIGTSAIGPVGAAPPHSPIRYLTSHSDRAAVRGVAAAVPLLTYHGGQSGVGVEPAPKVYVVFYGKQWGTARASGGNITFSGDPKRMAPRLQDFLRGLFGASDTWSTSTTQYCDRVAIGRVQCGSSGRHVSHPTRSPLGGVWHDNRYNAAAHPAESSIRASALRAAKHFGNTTAASNASAQYVIVSPTGIIPVGFMSQYCAYHSSAITTVGAIAYTNLPYIPDAGASCGQNFVNAGSAGTLDGVTLVEGHEYVEVVTDPFPATGWLDANGEENADKCAWIRSGPGAATNLALTTGRFAVQSLWSNNAAGGRGACVAFYKSPTDQH